MIVGLRCYITTKLFVATVSSLSTGGLPISVTQHGTASLDYRQRFSSSGTAPGLELCQER